MIPVDDPRGVRTRREIIRYLLRFAHSGTDQAARQVFGSSLVFLPTLLLLFVLDALLANGR